MTVLFKNPGVLDRRFLTTFGVSAKETDSPIGFFGTGLKYALAVLLRTGHAVSVYPGEGDRVIRIGTKQETLRGKEVQFVAIDGEPSPFTTDLGRQWDVWQAYRELYCNAMDEGGSVESCAKGRADCRKAQPGTVWIEVSGPAIDAVHADRYGEVLAPADMDNAKAYAKVGIAPIPNKRVFCRGIRVGDADLPCVNTYNVLGDLMLTEDRTVASSFQLSRRIATGLVNCTDRAILERALLAEPGTYEHAINYGRSETPPGDVFRDFVHEIAETRYSNVNPSALEITGANAVSLRKSARTRADLGSTVEAVRLDRAIKFCERHGFYVTRFPVYVVESLGPGVMGMAKDGSIYLADKALSMGTQQVAGTLIEEYLHLSRGVGDCSREMQNVLLDLLVSSLERVDGEPV